MADNNIEKDTTLAFLDENLKMAEESLQHFIETGENPGYFHRIFGDFNWILNEKFTNVKPESPIYGISNVMVHDARNPSLALNFYPKFLEEAQLKGDEVQYQRLKEAVVRNVRRIIAYIKLFISIRDGEPSTGLEKFLPLFDIYSKPEGNFFKLTTLSTTKEVKLITSGVQDFYDIKILAAASTFLLNVFVHSNATEAYVDLEKKGNEVYLTVLDNDLDSNLYFSKMESQFERGYLRPSYNNTETNSGASLIAFYLGQQCRLLHPDEPYSNVKKDEFMQYINRDGKKGVRLKFVLKQS